MGDQTVNPIREDRLFVVMWSPSGESWAIVKDETREGSVPAVYAAWADAVDRKMAMHVLFPNYHYAVVPFVGPEAPAVPDRSGVWAAYAYDVGPYLISAHPEDGFDAWYGEDGRLDFAAECPKYEEGEAIRLDVDRDDFRDLTPEQKALYEEWENK